MIYKNCGSNGRRLLLLWQRAGSSVAVRICPQPHPDDEHARLELACDDHEEVDTDYQRQYSFSPSWKRAATSGLEDIAAA